MIRIGNQTFHGVPFMTPFDFAVENQFRAFEWFPDRGPSGRGGWHEDHIDASTRRTIRKTSDRNKILLTVHAPLELDPLAPRTHGRWKSTLRFAKEIGARLIILHLDSREGSDTFAHAIAPWIRECRDNDIQIALENTVHTSPADFDRTFDAFNSIAPDILPGTGMCFDMGHANLCSATRNDYCGFLEQLAPDIPIIHLHLHENHGDRDNHLPLFTGPSSQNPLGLMRMARFLAARKFDGAGILEQWPHPPDLLAQTRDKLAALCSQAGLL